MHVIGPEGTVIHANQSELDTLGYTREGYIGHHIAEFHADQAAVDDILSRLRRGEDVRNYETRKRCKDGSVRDVLINAQVDREDGDFRSAICVTQDITNRNREEQQRARRHEAIFDQTYQFTGLMDPDGTLIEANRTALEFGGIAPEDALGQPFWEAYWWQRDEQTKQDLRDAIQRAADGEFVRYDVEVQGENEPIMIDFSIRPVTDEEGNVEYLIPEGRNITERKASEQLQAREKAYLENARDAITVIDADGIIQYESPAIEAVLGYEPDERIGENGFEYVHPDDRESAIESFQESLGEGPESDSVELRIRHQDGSWRWIDIRPSYHLDEPGIEGVVSSLRDVTERRRRENELEKLREQTGFALEQTDTMVFTWNPETDESNHLYQDIEEFLGIESTDIEGLDGFMNQVVHPDDRSKLLTAYQNVVQGESEQLNVEFRTGPELGSQRWLKASGYLRSDVDSPTLVGLIGDITDHKEIELDLELQNQALEEKSRWLNFALDATATGVWEWNLETDEMIWSESLERLLDIEPGTFEGTYEAHWQYLHPEDLSVVEEATQSALNGDGQFTAEFRMQPAAGDPIWVESRGELLSDEEPNRMTGTVTDISDRKDTERALARREILDPSVELEFHSAELFRRIQEVTDGRFEFSLDGVVAESDGGLHLYGTVEGMNGAETQTALQAIPTLSEPRMLATDGDSVRVEVSAKAKSIAGVFDRFEGELQSISIADGSCKVTGEFDETVDPEAVAEAVRAPYPDIELAGQNRVTEPGFLAEIPTDVLSDMQRAALEMAYFSGYFQQPRDVTGEELADQLGISRQAFNVHLRKAQARIFEAIYEDPVDLPG
ncbi:MAG: PAS domain S-box protein [Halobacteriales archaeon]